MKKPFLTDRSKLKSLILNVNRSINKKAAKNEMVGNNSNFNR